MASSLLTLIASLLLSVAFVLARAPSGPWDAFNYAPKTRVVSPIAVHTVQGEVSDPESLIRDGLGSATLTGNASWVTVDFGKEVGGLISLTFTRTSSTSSISLSFTESPMFISPFKSDDSSNAAVNQTYDGVLRIPPPLIEGFWTQPSAQLRGGFRYLTIVSNDDNPIGISNVTCSISFMPHVEDMQKYSGYFYAQDPEFHDKDFLTKLWYSGAYTVQTNVVPLHTGRQVPFVRSPGWQNDATLGVAGPIIVDGAKRDRAVWPGDMGIAVPTQFVSTNDLIPTRNALSTMFAAINPRTGALPESGPPLSQLDSDTYHAWTLIGTYNYYLYSGDEEWLRTVWTNYTRAVAFLESKVTPSGLMNVTGLRDWARLGGGGINSAGNALLYKVRVNSAELASYLSLHDLSATYSANATALKSTFNTAFWVPELGLYRDNLTTTLCPQDANSMAIMFNLTQTKEQAKRVSEGLRKNWNELGPIAPELPDNISPFISGLELYAHFQAGNDDLAMDLIRSEWGYMLYTNLSVQSTLLEGFTANGSLYYRSYRGYSYDAAYTSHAHGWSTGPTSALTFFVLGLQVSSPMGKTWVLEPHLSGLTTTEGGFETPLGWFGAKWRLTEGRSGKTLTVNLNTPSGTNGRVVIPTGAKGTVVTVDRRQEEIDVDGSIVVRGGGHTITIAMK